MRSRSIPAHAWLSALAATTTLASGRPAFAQEPVSAAEEASSNEGATDIVVTARRREERLQDIPISVSVYSSEDIVKKSLNDIQAVALATPNINYAAGYTRGKAAGNLIIRGVGQTNTDTQFEAGVGIYLDGVYIASMQGVNLDLLDTERVEVLRGPQGTLFGKNTIGGALNIVSKRPDDQLAGKFEVAVGQRNRLQAKTQANIPIIPGTIDMRIGLASEQAEGFGKVLDFATRRKIGETGDRNRLSGRAMVLLTLSDRFDALLSVDGRRIRESNTEFDLVGIQTGNFRTRLNALLTTGGLPLFDERFVTDSPYETYGTGPNFYDVDAYNLAGTLSWKVSDDISFKSITAYRDLKVGTGVDFDGSPYQLLEQTVNWKQEQFSQEFQLSGVSLDEQLNWVMGLFFMDFQSTDFRFNNFGGEIVALGGTPDARSNSYARAHTKSYAVFGQATYSLTDDINFTLGGRYSWDKRLFESYQAPLSNLNPTPTGGRGTWGAFSGTAALDYKISKDLMVYASVGRGYKGGIPQDLLANTPQPQVDPEFITSYEIGLKAELLDRKLRFNTALFHSDYNGLQLLISQLDQNTGRVTSFIANAAKVRIQGLEAELNLYPVRGMSLSASYGYTDAKYKDFQPGVPFAITNKLVETPKHTISLSGEYSVPLSSSLDLVPRLDWSYKSALEHDLFNRPLGHQNGYGVLNARVALVNGSENWDLALAVTNLTNKAYTVGSQNTTGAGFGFENQIYADPREWRVTARFSF